MKTQSPYRVQPDKSVRMSGAEVLVETLKAQGTEVIFGLIGATIMEVYDALHRDGTLRHLMVGHEQGGAHMAEGCAGSPARSFWPGSAAWGRTGRRARGNPLKSDQEINQKKEVRGWRPRFFTRRTPRLT